LRDPDVLVALQRLHSGSGLDDDEHASIRRTDSDALIHGAPPSSSRAFPPVATFVGRLKWGGSSGLNPPRDVQSSANPPPPPVHAATPSAPHQAMPSNALQFAAMRLHQAPPPRETYACARCGRRLHRMDGDGLLVPLEVDGAGAVLPVWCGGCGDAHSDWRRIPLLQR
jgi:hypothetical protein